MLKRYAFSCFRGLIVAVKHLQKEKQNEGKHILLCVFFIANNEQTNLKKENNTRPSMILASY